MVLEVAGQLDTFRPGMGH